MSDVEALLRAADTARAAGNAAAAMRHYQAAIALDPAQPRALNALGLHALAAGRLQEAVAFSARAAAAAPGAAELWLNLADAQRHSGDDAGEGVSLDRALAIEPYLAVAHVRKAEAAERQGDKRTAARHYGTLLNIVGNAALPPMLDTAAAHGREVIAADRAALGLVLETHLAGPRTAAAAVARFDRCVSDLLGRTRPYPSQPTGLSYPGLPLDEVFANALLPWLSRLEAATSDIQREFAALTGFAPYVAMTPGTPVNQWAGLNHSLDWGAAFLWRDGVRDDANCARCPVTAAVLAELPLLDMPGRGPAAFFSVLQPHTRIPPHTGVTNLRAVVHLPLVVPPGCGIRIGATQREWVIGQAFAFDDTIEHEAWNDSDEPRAVLIVDAWNPYLDDAEKTLLRALTVGLDAHAGLA